MMVNGLGDSSSCYGSFNQVAVMMRIVMFWTVVIPVVVSVLCMASRVMAMPTMVTIVMMASVMMSTVAPSYLASRARHILVRIIVSSIIGVHCYEVPVVGAEEVSRQRQRKMSYCQILNFLAVVDPLNTYWARKIPASIVGISLPIHDIILHQTSLLVEPWGWTSLSELSWLHF
jgi:hypothetical protein